MKKLCIHISNSVYSTLKNKILYVGWLAITAITATTQTQAQTLINISMADTTVEAVLFELRNQSDVNFVYNYEEVVKAPKVSVDVKDASVEETLEKCLKNTGLTYKHVNKTIVIVPVKDEVRIPSSAPRELTQTIRGKVVDRDSKVTLPFANVIVLNTNPVVGTTTDVDGEFKIEELPVGRHTVKVSYVGYEDAVIPELLLGSGKELIITVEISERVQDIDEIKVTAKKGQPLNQMATVSARSFSVEETKRYAASVSDPARMVQVFAGVSTGDDSSNEIIIRGNSPNWMLWRLEGVEIPSPNHFAEEGFVSGSVSILSSNMVGKSDFYTGAFPSEYGNALSGVFDIKLRKGNNENPEFTAQAGVLGFDISGEGPFKKGYKGSYLFNYRYSTFSLMNKLNIEISENALPEYQDLSFKFNLPTKKAGTFSVWSIGGLSNSDEQYLPDTTLGEKLHNGYLDYTETGMYATGISHTYFPDQKSYFKTVLSQSMSYSSENYDDMDSSGVFHDNLLDRYKNRANRITSYYNRKVSNRLTVRTGATFSYLDFNYNMDVSDSVGNITPYLNNTGNTQLLQAYSQGKFKFSDKVILTAGLHYSHFFLNKENSFEPRLGLSMKFPKNQKVSLGYGMHSRPENLQVYFIEHEDENGNRIMPNKSLKMTKSTHYVLSYEKNFGTDIMVKAETYYQHISDLAIPTNPEKYWAPMFGGINQDDTLDNSGLGRNYGLELTVQKFFTNNYYFLFSSSLFDSKYKAADGKWRNTKYNVNYINNFVAGKEFKWAENRLVGLNTKVLWSGGKRLVPIDLAESIEQKEPVYDMENLFSTKGSDYFRIDLGVKIHFYKAKTEHVLSLDIQNVTNRLNMWSEVYSVEDEKTFEYPMAGIIPILNYRIEF